jgi:hypothetical protein
MTRLHLCCGPDYREGWLNVDHSPHVRTDLCGELPGVLASVPDNSVEQVLAIDALEHFEPAALYRLLDELERVCVNGAVLDFVVPHFRGINSAGPFHRTTWNSVSFEIIFGQSACRERFTRLRVRNMRVRLLFWSRGNHFGKPTWKHALYNCGMDWFWNFGGRGWQTFWERANVFGFDALHCRCEVAQ